MYEMLFHYYPAFVARVIDASRAQIWLQHPRSPHINYDLGRTIVVDLDKTPSNPAIEWDDIEVDDFADHEDPKRRGFTTLGPVFPHNYSAAGIYISASYRDRFATQLANALWRSSAEPAKLATLVSGKPYEEVSIVRKDGATLHRFHGFHKLKQHPTAAKDRKLYIVAHAGTSGSKRSRCALVLQDNEYVEDVESWLPGIGTQAKSDQAADRDTGPIYILQETALAAELEIPKKPTGSGEGLMTLGEGVPASSGPRPGGPLNVFGEGAYDELERIQNRLRGNYLVIDRHDLDTELAKLIDLKATFTSFDLIGHSRARDGVLRFNNLALDVTMIDYVFTELVIRKLARLSIKEIRFLGCRTATSSESIDALKKLRAKLVATDIKVRGTTGDLFAVHYARGTGFMEIRLLTGTELFEHAPEQHLFPTPIEMLPLASESSTNTEDRKYWSSARDRFSELWTCVSATPDPSYTSGPLEDASAQVLYVDQHNKVRAFDLIPISAQGPKNRPLKGIRLNFAKEWRYHPVLGNSGSDKLYALITT